jgi:hypothetical protein
MGNPQDDVNKGRFKVCKMNGVNCDNVINEVKVLCRVD